MELRQNMSSFYSGKVILSGEHAVVFGQTAILASLNLGIKATIKEGHLDDEQKQDQYLQHLISLFSELISQKNLTFSLKIESDLPQKSGLGSSAAFAAAVLSELSKFYNYSLNSDRLYNLVLRAENFIHGQSSGADPAIVVYGGLIAFSQGKIKPIKNTKLSKETFFLIDSGAASESTGEMIKAVATRENSQAIAEQIGLLSKQLLRDLKNNSFNPELLDENQLLLQKLGVVGQAASQVINQLQASGANCKITGAGGLKTGSGYILAHHKQMEKLTETLQIMGLPYFKAHLGEKTNEEKN